MFAFERVKSPSSEISGSSASQSSPETVRFLRIPPFPKAKVADFVPGQEARSHSPECLANLIRELRVGGTYWGAQLELPVSYVLSRCSEASDECRRLFPGVPLVVWDVRGTISISGAPERIVGDCDPWHMLAGATALVSPFLDDVCAVGSLIGTRTYLFNREDLEPVEVPNPIDDLLATSFRNPFTGEPMSAREAVELCGFWRRLIDCNRDIRGGYGFAFWKQDNVAALLWGGAEPLEFRSKPTSSRQTGPVAVWRAKTSDETLAELERLDAAFIEVEDGFLRSQGLGADCVPPLSITVDRLGSHFDPAQASELERILQGFKFDDDLLIRARRLRRRIVEAGLGKYERAQVSLDRPAGKRRHILVPGQVEDDRSVQAGGCGLRSNLELLKRVRQQAPDAYILYKPHPDVIAGHRKGAIPDRMCLQSADEIVADQPISSLIEMADEIHVNTSLAGFEALMRGKPVTTHGVPFYAGWGLTRDLGPVPTRRTRRLSIDEMVAATLLLYPRYLDPVTGLPCPAEIVVERLCSDAPDPGLLVAARRLQGRLMRGVRKAVQ